MQVKQKPKLVMIVVVVVVGVIVVMGVVIVVVVVCGRTPRRLIYVVQLPKLLR